jgi:hypothetical protein
MLSNSIRVALFSAAVCLSLSDSAPGAQARNLADQNDLPAFQGGPNAGQDLVSSASVVYSQPPDLSSGALLQSSWWASGGDYDWYAWDNFTLPIARVITDIQWRGGYLYGSGGPVSDFKIAICASIPAGTQPDVVNPPLVEYYVGGNAGETLAGTFGGKTMYDYQSALPAPFQAAAGTKYWVQIEAIQQGIPDWGITTGTGGDGWYFRRRPGVGDFYYENAPGNMAFTLLGLPGYGIYLPLINK